MYKFDRTRGKRNKRLFEICWQGCFETFLKQYVKTPWVFSQIVPSFAVSWHDCRSRARQEVVKKFQRLSKDCANFVSSQYCWTPRADVSVTPMSSTHGLCNANKKLALRKITVYHILVLLNLSSLNSFVKDKLRRVH